MINLRDISASHKFHHADSEDLFTDNKHRFGKEWYWYDKSFSYDFNSSGFRMEKELSQVDYSNYYAFFGCSYTLGEGLPLEDTFAYKIAKDHGVDYINTAVGGSDCLLVLNKLVKLFDTVPVYPKCVIVNWPETYRHHFWFDDKVILMGPNLTPRPEDPGYEYWKELYKSILMEDTHVANRFDEIRKSVQMICKLAGSKLVEMTTAQANGWAFHKKYPDILDIEYNMRYEPADDFNISEINTRLARDIKEFDDYFVAHPGIKYQDDVVNAFKKFKI